MTTPPHPPSGDGPREAPGEPDAAPLEPSVAPEHVADAAPLAPPAAPGHVAGAGSEQPTAAAPEDRADATPEPDASKADEAPTALPHPDATTADEAPTALPHPDAPARTEAGPAALAPAVPAPAPAVPADEAALDASPDAPVLDSFAAEEPAEPADAAPTSPAAPPAAPDEAPPPAEAALAASPDQPVLDSFAAEEPVEHAAPAPAVPPPPVTAPRGSEGLTTAPPRDDAELREDAEPGPSRDDADPGPAGGVSGPRRAWLPLAAVGLAVALLAGATGWLAWQLRQQDRADTASVDAVAAARDAARLLFSYSHETLQADFDKGLAVTTGDFRSQYMRTTKDVVSPVATQYKAVVKAEVVEAAVVDARPDEVIALVFLNQATTSTRVQGQQVDQSRVRLRLVPRDGRWLVEEVKAL